MAAVGRASPSVGRGTPAGGGATPDLGTPAVGPGELPPAAATARTAAALQMLQQLRFHTRAALEDDPADHAGHAKAALEALAEMAMAMPQNGVQSMAPLVRDQDASTQALLATTIQDTHWRQQVAARAAELEAALLAADVERRALAGFVSTTASADAGRLLCDPLPCGLQVESLPTEDATDPTFLVTVGDAFVAVLAVEDLSSASRARVGRVNVLARHERQALGSRPAWHLWTPPEAGALRAVSECATAAALHFAADAGAGASVAPLSRFLGWLASYADLFSRPCLGCGALLKLESGSGSSSSHGAIHGKTSAGGSLLPPVVRTWRPLGLALPGSDRTAAGPGPKAFHRSCFQCVSMSPA